MEENLRCCEICGKPAEKSYRVEEPVWSFDEWGVYVDYGTRQALWCGSPECEDVLFEKTEKNRGIFGNGPKKGGTMFGGAYKPPKDAPKEIVEAFQKISIWNRK